MSESRRRFDAGLTPVLCRSNVGLTPVLRIIGAGWSRKNNNFVHIESINIIMVPTVD